MVLGEHAQRPHRRQETLSAVSPLPFPKRSVLTMVAITDIPRFGINDLGIIENFFLCIRNLDMLRLIGIFKGLSSLFMHFQ